MTIVRSLASWIAFAIAGALFVPPIAALVGLVAAVIGLAIPLGGGRRLAELVVETSGVLFFAGYVAITVAVDGADFHEWVTPAAQFWLAATVGATLVAGRPFTLEIAKTQAPPEIWDEQFFGDFNVRITTAWLISFMVAGSVLTALLVAGSHQAWMSIVVTVAAIVTPVVYTRRQVEALRKAAQV